MILRVSERVVIQNRGTRSALDATSDSPISGHSTAPWASMLSPELDDVDCLIGCG
jgi:hypothetical protein